jgi:hypothetical protein
LFLLGIAVGAVASLGLVIASAIRRYEFIPLNSIQALQI